MMHVYIQTQFLKLIKVGLDIDAKSKRFVGSSVNVILTRQTCGQRSSRAAESRRRALGNYFPERICNMFLISKCRGDRDLGLCTTSEFAFGEPQRNGKIHSPRSFSSVETRFFFLGSRHCAAVLQTRITRVVNSLRFQSPLPFDIRNI